MANLTLNDIPVVTSAAADDLLLIWRDANGDTRVITKDNYFDGLVTGDGAMTGNGTIATGGNTLTIAGTSSINGTLSAGGFTLTVPATGTAALLSAQNIFTAQQRINALLGVNKAPTAQVDIASGAADRVALALDTAASPTAAPLTISQNGTLKGGLFSTGAGAYSTSTILRAIGFDNGTDTGMNIGLDRNTNAGTPAAGYVSMQDLGGTFRRIWPDASGDLRIHNASPTNANDMAGTVVGDQSSHIDYKNILGEPISDAEALDFVCEAAAQVARFVYKSGAYNGEEFSGIVLDGDTKARYGMDADGEHAAGKSLNVINAIGDLFLVVRNLSERVAELEARV